jgi:hypothetical protein
MNEPEDSQNSVKPRLPIMERVGGRILRRWSELKPIDLDNDGIHILSREEQSRLRGVEFKAIARAACIGVISALFCALSWPAATWILGATEPHTTFWQNWRHYLIMFGVISVGTVIEIVLLYWNALHAVHRLSRVAGLQLFDEDRKPFPVTNALIQAALELPYSREETNGALPGREVSRWWVLTVAILYRLKVTFTYYLSKILVQRLLGRILVRWAIELIAIPVYAFWDALVTFLVVRKARINAMGPSMVLEAVNQIETEYPDLDDSSREILLCAVGCTVARNANLHPNVAYLLQVIHQRFGLDSIEAIDQSDRLLGLLAEASDDDRRLAAQVLSLSLVIDGRISVWERRLLMEIQKACGMPNNQRELKDALKSFYRGQSMQVANLA